MNGRAMSDSTTQPTRSAAVGGTDASRARVTRSPGGGLALELVDPFGRRVTIDVSRFEVADRPTFATWCEWQLAGEKK